MNRVIITMIAIITVITAVMIGMNIYQEQKVANRNNEIKEEEKIGEEEILDECTDEWENIDEAEKAEILQANSSEQKVSPNCSLILKHNYKGCNHSTSEYLNIPNKLVNKTEAEIQEAYPEWEIEKFSSEEIILCKNHEGECGEHYVLRDREGKVTVLKKNENGQEELFEMTDIATDYLAEDDKNNLKNGISINGVEQLNQIIEDFE